MAKTEEWMFEAVESCYDPVVRRAAGGSTKDYP